VRKISKPKTISPIGSNWEDVRKELFTPEEIAKSDLRVIIISELIKARREKGITQKQLEELSGVRQPVYGKRKQPATGYGSQGFSAPG
jgi:hypothetical protein